MRISFLTLGVTFLLFFLPSCSSVQTDTGPFAIDKKARSVRASYVEREFMKKAMEYRGKYGKSSIPFNPYLHKESYETALENARNHTRTGLMSDAISHGGFYAFKRRAQKSGWGWVSENVGMAYAENEGEAVDRLFSSLLKSSAHLAILRRDIYNGNAVAVVKKGNYYYLIHRFGDYTGE